MSARLPKGWVRTTLEEVCAPISNMRPEEFPDEEFTYIDIGSIDNKKNRIAQTKAIMGRDAPSRARQVVTKGDVLVSTVRTYLRNVAQIEEDYANPIASTGFAVVRAAFGISSQFLFYQILTEAFLKPLNALQTGSSYPAVRVSDVLSQSIVLPPAKEQERIVDKLNAALSRIERAEVAANRALGRIQHYRAAVLRAAIRGEFTPTWRSENAGGKSDREKPQDLVERVLLQRRERWERSERKRLRGNPPLVKNKTRQSQYRAPTPPHSGMKSFIPATWASISIDQLSWSSGYGTSAKCTYEAKGPGVLRIPNIRSGAIDFGDLKFAVDATKFREDSYIAPGDLLLIRTNGSRDLIGRTAIVAAAPKQKCSFASYLIRFRLVGDKVLWDWLSLIWDSALLRSDIESRAATTAGQYNVSLSSLATLAIPLPPAAEQKEIIRLTKGRLSAASQLAATLERQLSRARSSRELLLVRAMTGRLVPQNYDDEPASILLNSIRLMPKEVVRSRGVAHMQRSKTRMLSEPRTLLDILKKSKKAMSPEDLFRASGYTQDTVDQFFAELRLLTDQPAQVVQENKNGKTLLKAIL